MKIISHSDVDSDGMEYILVSLADPKINERNVYSGGTLLSFDMDNRKQRTTCTKMYFQNGGCHAEDRLLKTWKDEILTERECLQFAETVQI